MNIEISVREYFEELQLTEKQYGQEEELYPWIYMLLKMVECKKKNDADYYEGISIRDVHKMCKSEKLSDTQKNIRSILTNDKGVPDMAIIDKNSEHILGCIEIKTFIVNRFQDLIPGSYTEEKDEKGKTQFLPQSDSTNKQKPLNKQLITQVKNCKKVIYTNGLLFYMLKEKSNTEITVELIGDLEKSFEFFKTENESFDNMNHTMRSEWDKLIGKLIEIDWHSEPKNEIKKNLNT